MRPTRGRCSPRTDLSRRRRWSRNRRAHCHVNAHARPTSVYHKHAWWYLHHFATRICGGNFGYPLVDLHLYSDVRHRDYFIPVTNGADPEVHAERPTSGQAWMSFGLLLLSLVAVVGLAKKLSPAIEHAVEVANAPRAVVGIVIATLVLLPETWAAMRAARANRLQSSMNLAIGSALACIGLTVPVVVLASIAFKLPLVLGLEPKDIALLALTFLVSAFTLGTGRTYVLQGAVHLVMFAAFLFLAFVP